MTDKINGRTPEEIKLDLLADYGCCSECKYGKTTHDNPYGCAERALKVQGTEKALAYIQQLENHIGELTEMVQQLERERDALLKDFKDYQNRQFDAYKGPYACDLCKWGEFYRHGGDCKCPDSATCLRMDKWQWRGVQEVERQ